MNDNKTYRESFAALLDELAAGRHDRERWGDLVICHYDDELLESVRRQLVQIAIAPENEATFPAGQSLQFEALAKGLRQGDMPLKEREHE